MLRIILLGPPGAGKSTQAELICNKYGLTHISTEDIFRKHILEQSFLGKLAEVYIRKGELVPDKIIIELIKNRLGEKDCTNGFLLDGFPKTLNQAAILYEYFLFSNFILDRVILLDVPSKAAFERNTGRRICTDCGTAFHLTYNPPKYKNKCSYCYGCLIQRETDTEESMNNRLEIYEKEKEELYSFFNRKHLLHVVCGTQSVEEVFKNICSCIEN